MLLIFKNLFLFCNEIKNASLFSVFSHESKIEAATSKIATADQPVNRSSPSDSSNSAEKKYYPVPKRIAARSIVERGVGYSKGYATVEALVGAAEPPGPLVPLLDLRGHYLFQGAYAANIGLIARYPYRNNTRIFGANIYGDYRQGCIGHYWQLGLGIEVLGPRWDFRLNGSLPLTRQNHHTMTCYEDMNGVFFANYHEKECSFDVYNAEVGHSFVNSRKLILYLAAGPYFLSSAGCGSSLGGRARLRLQYNDYFSLEFSTCQDSIFHGIYQAELTITLPIYQLGSKKKRWAIFDRELYQPVQRFEIIPLKDHYSWETNF